MRRMNLSRLIAAVAAAEAGDRHLDARIEVEFRRFEAYMAGLDDKSRAQWRPVHRTGNVSDGSVEYPAPLFTSDPGAAIQSVYRVLPGWFWRVASCSVSDDAWVAPDYNHPIHGKRFLAIIPAKHHKDPISSLKTDIDRRPSGQPALALMQSALIGFQWNSGFLARAG